MGRPRPRIRSSCGSSLLADVAKSAEGFEARPPPRSITRRFFEGNQPDMSGIYDELERCWQLSKDDANTSRTSR